MKHRNHFSSAINLLCLEGAFAMAFDTWMGATYLGGLAGAMGVDVLFVTILVALPWIGAAGQLLSLGFLGRAKSLKRYTVRLAFTGRSLWLIPLAAAAFWGWKSNKTGAAFPAQAWFTLVALIAMVAALIGTSSGIAWSSWMRGLIPSAFQGRFFGLRHRHIMSTLLLANVLAAVIIPLKLGNLHIGYFIIMALAVGSAMVSSFILTKIPDARTNASAPTKASILKPLENPEFRKYLAFAAVFNGTVFFCAPYFSYFYTKELRFSLGTVAIWTGIANLGSFVAAAFWARRIDKPAGAFTTLLICGNLVAIAPLIYVFPSAAAIKWIAPFEFFINGIAWCGFTIANSTYLFRSCPNGRNSNYFSLYSATCGFAGAIGAILGGQAAQWLAPLGGFRALWLIGTVLRFAALWILLPPLRSKDESVAPDTEHDAILNRPPRTL